MRTIFLLAFLLAGCDEISAHDDPRDWGGDDDGVSTPSGSCSGVPIRCQFRIQSQCGGGCEVVVGCQLVSNQRCLSYDEPAGCEADADCFWIVDHCEPMSTGCSYHDSEGACLADDLDSCRWGPECTGYADFCNDAETEAACVANVGCEWIAD